MDSAKTRDIASGLWDSQIVPQLVDYIKIPNKSPMFDAQWAQHGYMDQAVALMETWAKAQPIAGMQVEVIRLPGRTPLIFIDIPGSGEDCVLLYGHLDKQPEMTGWSAHLGPWKPVIEGDRLYGRGGADDGYAIFGCLAAITALKAQQVEHSRCVVMIEACEESGSRAASPFYVDHLAARIGKPSLVVCLDSGCGNYDQLWPTTSLGAVLPAAISPSRCSTKACTPAMPPASSPRVFRITCACPLLSRLEDEVSGKVKPQELYVEIPAQRVEQARLTAQVLGDAIYSKFPFVDGMRPLEFDVAELALNRTWRPALAVTGIAGIPPLDSAGNVLRPFTAGQIVAARLPPTLGRYQGGRAGQAPAGKGSAIWMPRSNSRWRRQRPDGTRRCLRPGWRNPSTRLRVNFSGKPPAYNGEGGSILCSAGHTGREIPPARNSSSLAFWARTPMRMGPMNSCTFPPASA